MRIPRQLRDDARGFSLIEVLVAAFVLTLGVLATLTLFNSANRATVTTRAREGGTQLARELIEGTRGVPYENLNAGAVRSELEALPGLEDSAVGGIYTIERRNILYTVTPTVCTMDDAKDGGGSRPSGLTFCPDSVAAGTTDKNPEDYRRVAVTVSWKRDGITRSVSQSGIINNPGSATGPAVRTLFVDSTAAPYEITNPAASPLLMKLTTSSKPLTVTWSLDGSVQPVSPTAVDSTGLLWQFNWPVAALDDGPYLVSAEAFNQYGVSGPGRTETVTLNRYLPRKTLQFTGGRTIFNTVELEWAANTERDIIGYEVQRINDGAIVCSLATQKLDTFCMDSAPLSADPLFYQVRAYDKTPGTGVARPGPWSDQLTVVKANQPPNVPIIQQVTTSGGVVTLKWKRPNPEDPDGAPDGVAFYRVYRDGILQVDRYDRWFDGANSVTWQDRATGGSPHVYWVTAVDTHFAESAYAGPAVSL